MHVLQSCSWPRSVLSMRLLQGTVWRAQGYSVAAFLESIQQQVDREQREGGAGT